MCLQLDAQHSFPTNLKSAASCTIHPAELLDPTCVPSRHQGGRCLCLVNSCFCCLVPFLERGNVQEERHGLVLRSYPEGASTIDSARLAATVSLAACTSATPATPATHPAVELQVLLPCTARHERVAAVVAV